MNLTETVKAAGVVGAGGAGFPTHVKLNAQAEYFIVNAAECEPLIDTDKYLCRTYPERIVGAAVITAAHLGAAHCVIAIKGKYKPEIEALKKAIDEAKANVEIFEMPTFYPAGDEQTIVQMVTGKTVPERGIPLDVGAVVDNVGTMFNIYNATQGENNTHKVLSVVGEVKESILLNVPIGTHITECIKKAEPTITEYAVVMGGPMMGKMLTDKQAIENAVVTKTTGNLIVLPMDHYLVMRATMPIEKIKTQTRSCCIQCRSCTDLCPRYLIGHAMHPHLVMRNLWREDTITDDAEFERAFGDSANCCSCGVCEMFACPMGLSPRKVNDYMKTKLRERGIKVGKTENPVARECINERRTPTERLANRLGLGKYYGHHAQVCYDLTPETVDIPFSMHIGKPAVAVKAVGDHVKCGELLAAAAEGGLSANIHASIDGVIVSQDEHGAKISGKED